MDGESKTAQIQIALNLAVVGYIIEIANCPVLWVSTMQMTITTSTMKSEYTALLQALQSEIPLLSFIECATKGLKFTNHKLLTFKATVHEDNMGALILEKLEPGRHTHTHGASTDTNLNTLLMEMHTT